MSIANEITNYANGLSDAYDAVNDMQGIIPQDKNMNNLDTAIRTIPQSTGTTYTAGNGIDITNDVISIDDTVVAELSDIPTVNDAILTITQNGISAGTFTANSSANTTIALTDTTYSDFTGATSGAAGAHGLVPAPAAGDQDKALKGDGTWGDFSEKFVIMKYGEANAWSKFIDAYNNNKIVYCRASSNANPATGAQTRLAFMAYVSAETNPTNVEFQYVRSVGTKTSSQPVDQVFVYKLESTNGGTWSVQTRDMAPKLAAGTNTSVSYSSGTYTISATDTTYSNMTGATSSTAGAAGLVPAPAAGDQDKVLSGAGTWVTQSGGGSTYTAGNHIDITNDVISAEGYIWGDDAAPASTPASTITSAMIVDGTIQATDIATGVVPIITMTDTDPGEGSPLAANNFVAVYGDDPSTMNYSTTETKTGATWIDGSPIYKKTISIGALPNNGGKSVNHNISNLDWVVKTECFAKDSVGNRLSVPTPSTSPITLNVRNTDVYIVSSSDRSSYTTCYLTIYYTKSS